MNFILSRLIQSIAVFFAVSFFTYMMIGFMPGDPIDIMINANPYASADDIARLKAVYGLDQPFLHRYGHWLTSMLSGDFGYSRLFSLPVWMVVQPALIQSLILMGSSIVLSLLIAIPLGVWGAASPNGFLDRVVGVLSFIGISLPSFWFALMGISLFAVTLRWLPSVGNFSNDTGFWESITYYLLPIFVLTLSTIGFYIRFIRSAMIDVLQENFIQTARAKGLSKNRVLFVHAFRNAFVPLLMVVALDVGSVLSGALIVETMFSIQGMGKIIYDSIMGNDFNLAMITLLLATLTVLLANFMADVFHILLDPRLSVDKLRRKQSW